MTSSAPGVCYFKIFSGLPVLAAFSDRALDLGFGCASHELNRKSFLESIGISHNSLVCARQAHGEKVAHVRQRDKGEVIAGIDSFITEEKDVAIAVFTADCLPVFIYDRINKAIAIVHAGWRGSRDKITTKTLELMAKRFTSRPEGLLCAFGPAIRACCYEVKEEFKDYFLSGIIERDKKIFFDLAAVNKKQLLDFGVKNSQIEDSNICTACSVDDFFSYRREKDKTGRMMSVMMLK